LYQLANDFYQLKMGDTQCHPNEHINIHGESDAEQWDLNADHSPT
jgi:hypothetical protein